ncbi:MAG: hypothetical protein GF329_19025 [Candidatus Lokiarchaeota archaeon]|nr:hypothetical protein [Candidatus Lokiarchaeota archaeon]
MTEDDSRFRKEFQNLMNNFKKTYKSLQRVTDIFESKIKFKEEKSTSVGKNIGISEIMELPENLRKTALAAVRLRKNATLENISQRTKRDINLERGFTEALISMEILTKEKTQKGIIYKPSLGKKRSIISDDTWALLIKDSVEMVNFICNMEIEKAELKILDINEMMEMAPDLSEVFQEIKDSIYSYLSGLKKIKERFSKEESKKE